MEEIDLSDVLNALSDPVRREIVVRLAEHELSCSSFADCGSKTNLSYHFGRQRKAGIVHMRADGARRILSLRRDDMDRRFPNLLGVILENRK
ncbi:MAG: ArsR family transcriptional regulator [Capsulimonas sp.]|nr:ArsR family transcriptional regulator [Capsulimonas sp.]